MMSPCLFVYGWGGEKGEYKGVGHKQSFGGGDKVVVF